MYPKIYLSIDNCFATKRWTRPEDWARIISDCGLKYIESSADTECDMLYSAPEYLERWRNDTDEACRQNGVKIASVYTGHGTYSTLGLTHTDADCRERMLTGWMFPHIENAAHFGAIAGFYCHAFDETVLQSKKNHTENLLILYSQMEKIAAHCRENSVVPCLEQMYSPRQYPWRVNDGISLISSIGSKDPFYLTVDTGHQCGQKKFLRPTEVSLRKAIAEKTPVYVGDDRSFEILFAAIGGKISEDVAVREILDAVEKTDFLFAEPGDSDTYTWLEKIGRYAPIVHLQQTDGNSSSHSDFSSESNSKGIISGEKIISSLYKAFENAGNGINAPVTDRIYMTLELFYSNTTYNYSVIESIKKSVKYWRNYIPEDGMSLEEAYKLVSEKL